MPLFALWQAIDYGIVFYLIIMFLAGGGWETLVT